MGRSTGAHLHAVQDALNAGQQRSPAQTLQLGFQLQGPLPVLLHLQAQLLAQLRVGGLGGDGGGDHVSAAAATLALHSNTEHCKLHKLPDGSLELGPPPPVTVPFPLCSVTAE